MCKMMKDEDLNIGRLIARIHRGIYNFVSARLKDRDLDAGQFFFLCFILNNEGKTQEQIAKNILFDKATVSKAVKRLLHLGYVYREVNAKDKREYKIFATEKAKVLAPQIKTLYEEVYNQLHRHLDADEVLQLRGLLGKIYQNFE